ncbi:MAG: alpha/beta hydrolase, partial [Actinomycetes bacterium]
LGGSSLNWAAVAPSLADTCRVLALDLAGFGHTQGGARSTSVHANQRLLNRFLAEVAGTPAILVGNSMGGLISILQASAHPETVAGLVLVDPALPLALRSKPDPRVVATFGSLLVPAIGRRLMSRRREQTSAEESALAVLRLCCADVSRVPEHVVDLHVDLATQRRDYPDVDAEMIVAARSLMFVLADRRKIFAMQRAIEAPVLLLQGDQDRLVSIQSARAAAAANPSWRFEVAHGVGHVPQLEVPDWTIHQILNWLAEQPQASERATGATTSRIEQRS